MRYSDSVRLAIRATRSYWRGCTFERLKAEAMKDHKQALQEIIKKGYTWGLKHPLPFEWQGLNRSEMVSIRNSLFPIHRKNYNSSDGDNRNYSNRNNGEHNSRGHHHNSRKTERYSNKERN